MKARGKFIFNELIKKDGGSFTNEKGNVVNFQPSYALKVDERTERGKEQRTFKLSVDSPLIDELSKYPEYTEIILEFEIVFYSNGVRVVPVAIVTK